MSFVATGNKHCHLETGKRHSCNIYEWKYECSVLTTINLLCWLQMRRKNRQVLCSIIQDVVSHPAVTNSERHCLVYVPANEESTPSTKKQQALSWWGRVVSCWFEIDVLYWFFSFDNVICPNKPLAEASTLWQKLFWAFKRFHFMTSKRLMWLSQLRNF